MTRTATAAGKILLRVVLAGMLTVVVGVLVATVLLPRAVGGQALVVLSGSMTPEIPVGSVVVVRPVDPMMLEPGDVVTYIRPDPASGERQLVTHRILKVRDTDPQSFVLKGDANSGRDSEPVSAPNIQGEVWYHVPHVGTVKNSLTGGLSGSGATALGVLGLTLYALGQARGAHRDRNRKQASPDGSRQLVRSHRVLVVAEVPTAPLGLVPPGELTRTWNGVVLNEEAEACLVLLAPDPGDLSATLETLESADARDVRVLHAPTALEIIVDPAGARATEQTSLTGARSGGEA